MEVCPWFMFDFTWALWSARSGHHNGAELSGVKWGGWSDSGTRNIATRSVAKGHAQMISKKKLQGLSPIVMRGKKRGQSLSSSKRRGKKRDKPWFKPQVFPEFWQTWNLIFHKGRRKLAKTLGSCKHSGYWCANLWHETGTDLKF